MKNIYIYALIIIAVTAGLSFKYYDDQKTKRAQLRLEQILSEVQEEQRKEDLLDDCLYEAEVKGFDHAKLNGWVSETAEEREDGREVIQAPNRVWDTAREIEQREKDICFKKYEI